MVNPLVCSFDPLEKHIKQLRATIAFSLVQSSWWFVRKHLLGWLLGPTKDVSNIIHLCSSPTNIRSCLFNLTMLNLSISICLHFHCRCNVQKQVDHIRTFREGMIHDALQRCVCRNFGLLAYVASFFFFSGSSDSIASLDFRPSRVDCQSGYAVY